MTNFEYMKNNAVYIGLLEQGYKPNYTKCLEKADDDWLLMVKHFEHPVHGQCNISQWIKPAFPTSKCVEVTA